MATFLEILPPLNGSIYFIRVIDLNDYFANPLLPIAGHMVYGCPLSHHCMAHRLEIAFGHSMKKFPVFRDLEDDQNKLYGFFHNSDKRYALFHEYLKNNKKRIFRFRKIFKVR